MLVFLKREQERVREGDGPRDRAGTYKVQDFRQPVCNEPS